MRQPSVEHLPPSLRRAAVEIAEQLGRTGQRAWLVGGVPRDLALERVPGDLDFATAARPEEVEAVVPGTIPVGRAFGTLVLPWKTEDGARLKCEVTTFRSERGYSDQRRPDAVQYGATLEEDARRRDFTCNTLYLDPLADEVRDPERGLEDLAAGRLRAVGEPGERFREDGLRLLRLARFAGTLGLEVEPATRDAARAELASLDGVSPERVLHELESIFRRPHAARALEVLRDVGALVHALPGAPEDEDGGGPDARVAWLAAAGSEELALAAGLAVLLGPPDAGDGAGDAGAALAHLRPSRELSRAVEGHWRALRALEGLQETGRAARVRLVRDPLWPSVRRLALASAAAGGEGVWVRIAPERVAELDELAAGLSTEELHPAPLLDAEDLAASGLPRGKQWGEVLAAAAELQLEGELTTRERAREWLAEWVAQRSVN